MTAVARGVAPDDGAVAVKNVPAKEDREAEKQASIGSQGLPQKLPQKGKKPEVETTAKTTAKKKKAPMAEDFAVDFFDDDDDFAPDDFFAVDGVDSRTWRIEKRFYGKQDGTTMMYYNYRQRKGVKDKKTGKRKNIYRKGGNRVFT